jgi:hypothetical protein
MPIPTPLVLDDAGLALGDGAVTEVFADVSCSTSHIEISPDTAVTEINSLCGSLDWPGLTKWSLVATLTQSLDAGATEDVLSAAVESGVEVGFKVIPYRSTPVSATNPMWTGRVRPQPYAPISGDAGGASEVELEWAITEGPIKEITGTYPAQAEAQATEKATAKSKAA